MATKKTSAPAADRHDLIRVQGARENNLKDVIPGYSMEGWYGRISRGCGFFDPDKPIARLTRRELHDLLHNEATRIKVDGINLTYAGLIPSIQKSFLSKDVDALQPRIRAFVDRAITFQTCPECQGTRLSEAARSCSIADACAMQISDLADWIIDLGPGAGHEGGQVVFEGLPAALVKAKKTLTGRHLAGYVAG